MRSAESRYLPVPPRGEILAEALEAEELAQCLEMFGQPRTRPVHLRLFEKLTPSLMRKQRNRTQLAAFFEVREDFAGDTLLFFDGGRTVALGAVFDERFLRVCGFAMNQPHGANELIPGLAVHVTIFAGVHRGEFPFVIAGKRFDCLNNSSG